MENEPEEYGYTEPPPEGAHGRTNPPTEKKAQYERPIYEIPVEETSAKPASGGNMNYAVLTFAGLLVLAIFGAYFYQNGGFAPPRPAVVQTQAQIQPPMVVTGDKAAVRIELVRTIDLLNQIEAKLIDRPTELAQVRQLKEEAKSLIESMGE